MLDSKDWCFDGPLTYNMFIWVEDVQGTGTSAEKFWNTIFHVKGLMNGWVYKIPLGSVASLAPILGLEQVHLLMLLLKTSRLSLCLKNDGKGRASRAVDSVASWEWGTDW
jgi:hypothetical protein